MSRKGPASIGRRIRRSILGFAAFLAVAGGASVWIAAFTAEDRVLARFVDARAERIRMEGITDDAGILRVVPASELDDVLAGAARARSDGTYEIESAEQETCLALVHAPDGVRYAVVGEIDEELTNARLATLLAAALVAAMGLATFVASRSAAAAVEPVERLANLLAEERTPERGFADAFDDDEVGFLALKLDETLAAMTDTLASERMFLADASHELRTPLSVIATTVEVMERTPASRTGDDARRLARVSRATRRMRIAVDSLLWLAREERGETALAPADFVDELDQLAMGARDELSEGVTLRIDAHEDSLPEGRTRLWLVALSNLLANAIHHTDAGEIEVSVRRDRIAVRDTGRGMTDEMLARAVEPWTHGTSDGIGLGLSIVQRIAARHGWKLELSSEEGEGTLAELSPRASNAAHAPFGDIKDLRR